MSINVEATLLPVAKTATHVVGSSPTTLPRIVERVSECGALRMHLPLSVPDRIEVRVERVQSHGFAPPPHVAVGKNVVLQGVIVRAGGEKMLVSHSGMLMSIGAPGISTFGQPGDFARTTISF